VDNCVVEERTEDEYDVLKEQLLSELDELGTYPHLDNLMNQKLSNSSEETDFAVWRECLIESVDLNRNAVEKWASA
jgi:hypothetical protein